MDDSALYLQDPAHGVLLPFLRQERPDWQGRWLRDMRAFDLATLERDHQYIQWLFPLDTESEVVFAPRLRPTDLHPFREDTVVRHELRQSFDQMLAFFGFQSERSGDAVRVTRAVTFSDRAAGWLSNGNHNYRRISRMLGSLSLASLSAEAQAFLSALESLAESPAGASVNDEALSYWRRRVAMRPAAWLNAGLSE